MLFRSKTNIAIYNIRTPIVLLWLHQERNFPFGELRGLRTVINWLIRISKGSDNSGEQKVVTEVQVH